MRIPSGDLAPVRRGRTRRGRRSGHAGLGSLSRKRRSKLPVVLAVLLVAAVAAGAYLLTRDDAKAPARTQRTLAGCPTAPPARSARPAALLPATRAATVRLPAPGTVALRLLNGTSKAGQARSVADQLVVRGFRVTSFGNAPRLLAGASTISYGPAAAGSAQLVSAYVPAARLVPVPRAPRGSVDVVLGSSFGALRTPAQTAALVRRMSTPSGAQAAPASRAAVPARTPCR